jgi:arsenate reductase (glutaredoxin)
MTHFQIYHNPRCSKSRQTLALLQQHGIEPELVLYLDNPPSVATLKKLLKQLNMNARQLLRTGEEEYATLGLADKTLSDETLIAAMNQHPRLIERPIVVKDQQAVVGRPPENVLTLIDATP